MGAWVSVLLGMDGAAAAAAAGPAAVGLGDLPEICAAQVLLHIDPSEICRLAQLNHAFRGAARVDFVWEAKLLENYKYPMEFVRSGNEARRRAGKKEIYARPVPFGDGQKEDRYNLGPVVCILLLVVEQERGKLTRWIQLLHFQHPSKLVMKQQVHSMEPSQEKQYHRQQTLKIQNGPQLLQWSCNQHQSKTVHHK